MINPHTSARRRAAFDVWIPGRPAPQGSMTPIRKGPRLGVRSANDKILKPWRAAVSSAAADARGAGPLTTPVEAMIDFVFRRPAAHYGSGRNAAILKPSSPSAPMNRGQGDIDKLCRAALDALTDANVITDDAIIVQLHARKLWADGPAGAEGCRIQLRPATRTA
ncbi:MAG: hypothetical protein JWM98_1798 [Thermoleophilia bacterium]|nr:hypothetical protein [Thermoleophilia bacterium]